MIKDKNARVGFLSLLSRIIRLLSGPVTLLIISKELNSEELGFYYVFFSLISMQQLAELGIGHVLRQYISHSYYEKNGCWEIESIIKIKNYFKFSIIWFFCVSIFIVLFVGFAGYFYLSLNNSSVNWEYPWVFLIAVTAMNNIMTPIKTLIEGVQKQEVLIKSQLIAGVFGSIVLWLSVYLGYGLYSISISSLITAFISFSLLYKPYKKISCYFEKVNCNFYFKIVFFEIWPLLKNVSIVWGVGFLFWNTFNLVSFRFFEPFKAGEIIFGYTLALAGFNIAESITQGQMSIFSNFIGNNKIEIAKLLFKKYMIISMTILILGYFLFIAVWYLIPGFYIYNKIPSIAFMIQLFLYFIILLYKTLLNNFIRCFNVEPFVKTALIESLLLPFLFIIGIKIIPSYPLILCISMLIVMLFVTNNIGNKVIKQKVFLC